MSDVEAEQKREEDERLDTAEDPNEEVRSESSPARGRHLSKFGMRVSGYTHRKEKY